MVSLSAKPEVILTNGCEITSQRSLRPVLFVVQVMSNVSKQNCLHVLCKMKFYIHRKQL